MQIKRRFTVAGASPYRGMQFESRSSGLTKRDGTSVFSQDAVVVPTSWDQTSTDILAQKHASSSAPYSPAVPRPPSSASTNA